MRRALAAAPAIVAGALIAAVPAGAAEGRKAERPAGAVAAVPKGHCVPIPGFYMADRVIRGRSAGRSEVTELFGDGSYRVTRCDARGRLLRMQHVARMRVRHGGRQPVILSSARRDRGAIELASPVYASPDSAKEARAFARETRARLLARTAGEVLTVGARRNRAPALQAAQSECDGGSYSAGSPRLLGIQNYHISVATLPSDGGDLVKQQEFAMRIVNGHDVWNFRLGCGGGSGRADRWQSVYLGPTGAVSSYHAGLPMDGLNVIDAWYGPICGSNDVLVCVGSYLDPLTFSLIETDTRYNLNYDLTNSWWSGGDLVGAHLPPGDRYDAFAVTSHEAGHELGCGHSSTPGQTMYPFIGAGEHHQRDLGRGDLDCLDVLYGL